MHIFINPLFIRALEIGFNFAEYYLKQLIGKFFTVQEFELCLSKLKQRKLGQKQYVRLAQIVLIQCWPIPQTVFLPLVLLPS